MSSLIINLLLAGPLNQIWGMINNLQLIVHLPLINVIFPGNAFMIFDYMIPIATFDFAPTDAFYPLIFTQLEERDAWSNKFDRLNYGSMYLIMNMGTLFGFFVWELLLYATYPLLYCLGKYF